ncbi:MAG TPA: ferredoxin [Clostridiaceae bacterium]
MKASVDQEGCIGCELCTDVCPSVFSMNDEGKAQAIDEDIPSGNKDEAQEASDGCPVSVIDIK